MVKQKRNILLKVRVTPEERGLIEKKMAQLGTDNMAAYMRKMAIDGYVVKLDLPELRELVSLLRYSSNNLNQLTRRVHETGRIYAADMDDILQNQERIWQTASGILSQLAAIK
ncbi:MAG: plasmid mobilization relaxosome protein MobC [Clostridium sp.]|nr:plasmid mobilization relaxosome protein MobC [Clostridium sp.]